VGRLGKWGSGTFLGGDFRDAGEGGGKVGNPKGDVRIFMTLDAGVKAYSRQCHGRLTEFWGLEERKAKGLGGCRLLRQSGKGGDRGGWVGFVRG